MSIVKTEGLILKSFPLSEADKIVVIFTKEHGLVRAVAKGARRLNSKFGSGLEPFSIVGVTYLQREERELVTISDISLCESYFGKAAEPEFLQTFSYLFELLYEFAPPHQPNEPLYRMARVCLETVDESDSSLESIAMYFELWLLRLSGYLPNWSECDDCNRGFADSDECSLQIDYHLLCLQCQRGGNKSTILAGERQLFLSAQVIPPADFVRLSVNRQDQIGKLSSIFKRIISNILGREVNIRKVAMVPGNVTGQAK